MSHQYLSIISEYNGNALDVSASGSILSFPYHGDFNQQFRLVDCPSLPGFVQIVVAETKEFVDTASSSSPLRCVDVIGCNEGANICCYEMHGEENQAFRLEEINPGEFRIVSAINGFVLTLTTKNVNPIGTDYDIVLFPWSGDVNGDEMNKRQLWRVVPAYSTMFPYFTENEMRRYSFPYREDERLDGALECLQTHGFTVIEDVYTPDMLEHSKALIGKDLLDTVDIESFAAISSSNNGSSINSADRSMKLAIEKLYTSLKESDTSHVSELWKGSNFFNPNKCGLSQGECAWEARLNSRIKAIYQEIYKDDGVLSPDDLCVGMDRLFYNTKNTPGARRTDLWPHCDFNPCHDSININCKIFQSILYLWDSKGENNATTVVWPDSHVNIYPLLIRQLMDNNIAINGHFIKCNELMRDNSNLESFKMGNLFIRRFLSEGRRLSIRPGSLLIWNSRLIHQGWTEGQRLAIPICYEPKNRRSELVYRRKLRVAAIGLPTTHWASLGIPHYDTVGELDTFKPGLVDQETGDCVLLPIKAGGARPYCWKPDANQDEVRKAIEDLRLTNDLGTAETDALKSFIRDEILNAL